jgi:hypothetical protein
MIAEGPKHPDLIAWYWDNVVSRALAALRSLLEKGVDNGEFRQSALNEFPQLLVTPVLFSVIWMNIFQPHSNLDTDRFIEAHVEMVLDSIKVKTS